MNVDAARLARAACDKFSTPDKPRFVAGALGPTPQDREHQPRRERPGRAQRRFRALRAAYYEQAEAWSKAAPTCCWSRRSSTRSTPRPRSSRSTSTSTTAASACR
jgi:hypothetical protein